MERKEKGIATGAASEQFAAEVLVSLSSDVLSRSEVHHGSMENRSPEVREMFLSSAILRWSCQHLGVSEKIS